MNVKHVITRVSIVKDYRPLRSIETKLLTAPIITHPRLEGVFYRAQDFTRSYGQLSRVLMDEEKAAQAEFPISHTQDELHGNLAKHEIRLHSSGENHFTTYDLSPVLRHFINDSCRILEPLVVILAEKNPDHKLGNRQSLDSYITRLGEKDIKLDFDTDFIVELYEIWNDYKHRTTKGVLAGGWQYEKGEIIKPKIILPKINVSNSQLNNIEVEKFQEVVCIKVLEFLNYLTSP